MTQAGGGEPRPQMEPLSPLLNNADLTLTDIRWGLNHWGAAIELVLARLAVRPDMLDAEVVGQLDGFMGQLHDISVVSNGLAAHIAARIGVEPPAFAEKAVAPTGPILAGALAGAGAKDLAKGQDYPETPLVVDGNLETFKASFAARGFELPTGEALYARIAPARLFPPTNKSRLDNSKEEIVITIQTDDTVIINDKPVVLRGGQRYLFNALMLLRDAPRTATELRSLGFRFGNTKGTTDTLFSQNMRGLNDTIEKALGETFIHRKKVHRNSQYYLDRIVHVLDERPQGESPGGAANGLESLKKN